MTTRHDAREAVLRRLADRYDRFAEEEQALVGDGRYTEAEGAHGYALLILRAYKAEQANPRPPRAQTRVTYYDVPRERS